MTPSSASGSSSSGRQPVGSDRSSETTKAMWRRGLDSRCSGSRYRRIGAHMLLGIPMHELANRVVDVETVLPSSLRELPSSASRTFAPGKRGSPWSTRSQPGSPTRGSPRRRSLGAWNALVRTSGRVPVGALAERLGRSRRHLSARFREHVGSAAEGGSTDPALPWGRGAAAEAAGSAPGRARLRVRPLRPGT